MSITYEIYPCEDERRLNGLHIEKAFRDIYDVWSINVPPQVAAADCDEIEDEDERAALADLTVDAGGWFMVTPTIRCSLEAIVGKGWRIQLHRKAVKSGNLSPIQSFTMWGMVYDPADAYGSSLVAAHTVLRFLGEAQAGTHRLWRTPDAAARGLFPGVSVEQARRDLDIARATASAAWVQLAESWTHYLHEWPMNYHFTELGAYFDSHRDHPDRGRFTRLKAWYDTEKDGSEEYDPED